MDINKQTWTKVYRGARLLERYGLFPGERCDWTQAIADAYAAYYGTGRYHRDLVRRIAETRWDRNTLPINIMKHAIKRAAVRRLQPIEVYWEIQPRRFAANRLP